MKSTLEQLLPSGAPGHSGAASSADANMGFSANGIDRPRFIALKLRALLEEGDIATAEDIWNSSSKKDRDVIAEWLDEKLKGRVSFEKIVIGLVEKYKSSKMMLHEAQRNPFARPIEVREDKVYEKTLEAIEFDLWLRAEKPEETWTERGTASG